MAAMQPGVMEPVEQEIRETLSRGGNVWLVGKFENAENAPLIKPAGLSHELWLRYWSARVMSVLSDKDISIEVVSLPLDRAVNGMEDPPLRVARRVLAPGSPDP